MTRLRDERGVFVPGLMGAGILLSIVMLVTDGVRRVFPVRGPRARAAHARRVAQGRVNDLLAVARGIPPVPVRAHHVPRKRGPAAVLGLLATGIAGSVVSATDSIFHAQAGVLAERGWTLGAGYSAAAIFAAGGAIWLLSAALDDARPRWLHRLAAMPPLGSFPDPEEAVPPWAAPYEEDQT